MTSPPLYPPIAAEEGELDVALDDDGMDIEDGEIDPADEPIVAATEPSVALQQAYSDVVDEQHQQHEEPEVVRPSKKRKIRHSKSKASQSKSHASRGGGGSSGFLGNDDFWDDSDLIDAWDRAMDRQKRKDRGDPVSDSDDEPDQPHADSESQQLSAEEQANADAYVEALWQQQSLNNNVPPAAAAGAPAPLAVPDQDLAELTDAEILNRATQYSYMAGYYAGYLAGRREKRS